MNWQDNFQAGKEIILATCSQNGQPNANVVMSLGFVDDKLLVADCQMKTTIANLKENLKVCVIGGYLRAKGTVEIFSDGQYFDLCVQNNKDYKVKHAILIDIQEVFDLDKGVKIKN